MRRFVRLLLPTAMLAVSLAPSQASAQSARLTGDLPYRMTLLRAAPGKLGDLVTEVRGRAAGALVVRHWQGDHWDIFILRPLSSPTPTATDALLADRPFPDALVDWQEDTIVRGPAFTALEGFMDAGLYHLEMMDAAAGRRADLIRQREMENAYQGGMGRTQTLIFVREFGGPWDVVTVGYFRNWRHYAERESLPAEKGEAAARAAGFASESEVSIRLRSMILSHNDTLGGPIRPPAQQ